MYSSSNEIMYGLGSAPQWRRGMGNHCPHRTVLHGCAGKFQCADDSQTTIAVVDGLSLSFDAIQKMMDLCIERGAPEMAGMTTSPVRICIRNDAKLSL